MFYNVKNFEGLPEDLKQHLVAHSNNFGDSGFSKKIRSRFWKSEDKIQSKKPSRFDQSLDNTNNYGRLLGAPSYTF